MELKISKLRIVILGIWALFMGKMGEIPQSISILLLMMVIDQVSGILACALKHHYVKWSRNFWNIKNSTT